MRFPPVFSRLAAATFGYGLRSPSLHRSAGNMTLAVHLATSELERRGYRRIGLALSQWVELRAENAYTAAMLSKHDEMRISMSDASR